jgi:hypothetical protein
VPFILVVNHNRGVKTVGILPYDLIFELSIHFDPDFKEESRFMRKLQPASGWWDIQAVHERPRNPKEYARYCKATAYYR